LHSIGHFLLLGGAISYWKYQVKRDFLQQINQKELVAIPKNVITKFFDNGKELEFQGNRYDIVRSSPDFYFCWHDAKETTLWKSLFQQVIQKESKSSPTDFSILKDFFKIYFIENQFFILIKVIFVKVFLMKVTLLHSSYFSTFWLPPKVF
jgi:hypothetical protein